MTTSTCEVLAPICAGFIDGTQPDVCSVTPAPTEAVCIDTDRDCNGECFGHALIDSLIANGMIVLDVMDKQMKHLIVKVHVVVIMQIICVEYHT